MQSAYNGSLCQRHIDSDMKSVILGDLVSILEPVYDIRGVAVAGGVTNKTQLIALLDEVWPGDFYI